jgi:hypothetical protein
MTSKFLKVSQEMRNNFMGFHDEINRFIQGHAKQLNRTDKTIEYSSKWGSLQ